MIHLVIRSHFRSTRIWTVNYPSPEGDGLVRKRLLTAAAKQVKRETSLDKFRVVVLP
jgi:hypothetical protein